MTQAAFQDSPELFITGVGRLVQGDAYNKQTKDYSTQKELAPEKQKYYVGVAFDKTQDAITKFPTIWGIMQQAAAGHPAAAMFAKQNWSGFKFKFEDGDAPKNADKVGWKGCWILKFSNGFAPTILDENQMDVSQNPDAVYRGCYVRIVGSAKQNGASGDQAGIYLNFGTIQRVAHGEPIRTGPDVRALLGGAPVALPPGASAIPQAAPGGIATAGMPGAAPVGMPGAAPAGVPAGLPAGPGAPPAMTPPPAAPAPVDKQSLMLGGLNYQQHIDAGWNDELLVAHGKMQPVPAPVAAPAPAAPPAMTPPPAAAPMSMPGAAPVGQPIGTLPVGVPSAPAAPAGMPGMPHSYAQ